MIHVIGGSGFIGSALCRLLSKQAEDGFNILDIKESESFPERYARADVTSLDSLTQTITPESTVVNLAAEHRDDVRPLSLYDEVNVEGAKNICAAARVKNVKRIIFTSSVAVYGFAPIGTDESGKIAPFNDYGRTKYEAEVIFRAWQAEKPTERSLVVIRPTVVFGEANRGNVYNLLKQLASGKFVMIGNGNNRKSMAYVKNIAAFLAFSGSFGAGVHTYNYVDKPDYTMNDLVRKVNRSLERSEAIRLRLPFVFGYAVGKCFDLLSFVSGKKFPISAIRVKKFCSDSVYNTNIDSLDFQPPVSLETAFEDTVQYEFGEEGNKKSEVLS
ncbi:MAG: UDP-N-acetylglucosamine 4-epimerase [Alteromonadaceae bacterium]|nr:MAG: UDP-N-acetylglucosamine 4-epimerase [Alteromonadaceae bacterium]